MIECLTSSGVLHDLENLNPYEITLEEIAHSLSMQCRYNGHTKKFYSVAEHCVHLVRQARVDGYDGLLQRKLLMHDASEAYIGDVIRHLKAKLPEFNALEDKICSLIFKRFGISSELSNILKEYDLEICKSEMTQLMDLTNSGAWVEWAKDRKFTVKVQCWSPARAKREFLREAKRLQIK